MSLQYHAVIAELEQQRDALDAAIRALRVLCATPDVEPAPAPPVAPVARRSRKPATTKTPNPLRAPKGHWQAKALEALRLREPDATVHELVTRLRVPDAERETAGKSLWAALQTLVAGGTVERHGTRYRLVRAGEAA